MNEDELRKFCSEKAMEFVKDGMVIGLGAGKTISVLVELLSKAVKDGLNIKIVTPSDTTLELCVKNGINVVPTSFIEKVDVAFDGCGVVDENFFASKNGGGVYLKEKIIASMAEEYILLIDENKYTKTLSNDNPVSVEVIKDSMSYACKRIKALGGEPKVRKPNNKDGFIITDDGNVIIDIWFKNITDFRKLNNDLMNITGVICTSVFAHEVTKLIIASENGVRVVSK